MSFLKFLLDLNIVKVLSFCRIVKVLSFCRIVKGNRSVGVTPGKLVHTRPEPITNPPKSRPKKKEVLGNGIVHPLPKGEVNGAPTRRRIPPPSVL